MCVGSGRLVHEAHWNAFATRRGPVAHERDTLELAFLLAGGKQSERVHEIVADTDSRNS
jgi:hypothetical protein